MSENLDRRTFVAGAAVAGVAAVAGAAVANASEKEDTDEGNGAAPEQSAYSGSSESANLEDSDLAKVASEKSDPSSDYYQSLQFLLDKNAIQEALIRYTRAMDRVDWDLIKTFYDPDCVCDYGMYYQGDFAGFVDYVNNYHFDNTYCRQHRCFNQTITIAPDGKTAASESYLFVTLREKFVDGIQGLQDVPGVQGCTKEDGYYQGQLVDTVGYGRYLDCWKKEDDGTWRVTQRIYNQDFGHQQPIIMPVNAGGSKTSDSTDDPSYKILDNEYLLAQ